MFLRKAVKKIGHKVEKKIIRKAGKKILPKAAEIILPKGAKKILPKILPMIIGSKKIRNIEKTYNSYTKMNLKNLVKYHELYFD